MEMKTKSRILLVSILALCLTVGGVVAYLLIVKNPADYTVDVEMDLGTMDLKVVDDFSYANLGLPYAEIAENVVWADDFYTGTTDLTIQVVPSSITGTTHVVSMLIRINTVNNAPEFWISALEGENNDVSITSIQGRNCFLKGAQYISYDACIPDNTVTIPTNGDKVLAVDADHMDEFRYEDEDVVGWDLTGLYQIVVTFEVPSGTYNPSPTQEDDGALIPVTLDLDLSFYDA